MSQKRLRWFDVRNSTSSGKWESWLLFSDEMICRFIFVIRRMILVEFFFIFLGFLIVSFLHFNGSISTFVFPDELDWLAVLIFHSKITQIRDQSIVFLYAVIFVRSVWFIKPFMNGNRYFLVFIWHYFNTTSQKFIFWLRQFA